MTYYILFWTLRRSFVVIRSKLTEEIGHKLSELKAHYSSDCSTIENALQYARTFGCEIFNF